MSGFESIYRAGLFQDQVIFITGGGSGIGRCTAHELASLGATVVIGGRRRELLEKTAAEIAESGGRVDVVEIDIRNEESVDAAFDEIGKKHSRIDGLFNNAGGQFLSSAADLSPKGFRSVVDLDLNATFIMCRAAYLHGMRENGGSIVNMLVDFRTGYPQMCHSAAARAGIENLTKSLALEWSVDGVRLNCVLPGDVLSSGMTTYTMEIQEETLELAKSYPLGRLATESEVSAAAVFLLGPASTYMTGGTLTLAGGSDLQKKRLMPSGGDPRTKPYNGFHLKPDLKGSPLEKLT